MRYAWSNTHGRSFSAEDAPSVTYHCTRCRELVTLKRGEIRRAHFAHRPDSTCPLRYDETFFPDDVLVRNRETREVLTKDLERLYRSLQRHTSLTFNHANTCPGGCTGFAKKHPGRDCFARHDAEDRAIRQLITEKDQELRALGGPTRTLDTRDTSSSFRYRTGQT